MHAHTFYIHTRRFHFPSKGDYFSLNPQQIHTRIRSVSHPAGKLANLCRARLLPSFCHSPQLSLLHTYIIHTHVNLFILHPRATKPINPATQEGLGYSYGHRVRSLRPIHRE